MALAGEEFGAVEAEGFDADEDLAGLGDGDGALFLGGRGLVWGAFLFFVSFGWGGGVGDFSFFFFFFLFLLEYTYLFYLEHFRAAGLMDYNCFHHLLSVVSQLDNLR